MKKRTMIWKKTAAVVLCMVMLFRTVGVQADVDVSSKLSAGLQERLEGKEEEYLCRIWLHLDNPITDKMIEQMLLDEYGIVYPPTSGGSEYIDYCIMKHREIVNREYSAFINGFIDKYVNPDRKILYKGTSATMILEATKEEIETYAKLQEVTDMILYNEGMSNLYPVDDKETPPEFVAALKEDYLSLLNSSSVWLEDIVFKYYGAYEKCHVVWMHCLGWADTMDERKIRIGDYSFVFGSGSASERFYAYADHTFIPVKTAYTKGLLSDKEVEALAQRYGHTEYHSWNYVDVQESDWFYSGARFCVQNGIMVGVDHQHFEPNRSITRAEFIAALYRLAGRPGYEEKHSFKDIPKDSYYASAVSWGAENKIIYGTSETTFAPDALITREEIACFVARYVQMVDPEFLNDGLIVELAYYDFDAVSEFAKESVNLIRHEGLMMGNANGMFYPQKEATRAEAATVFKNLLSQIV